MLWPLRSSDLNPTEHLWSVLKRQLNNRPRKPTNKEEMVAAILEEWEKIPLDTIIDLVASMNKRVAAVLQAQEGPTSY